MYNADVLMYLMYLKIAFATDFCEQQSCFLCHYFGPVPVLFKGKWGKGLAVRGTVRPRGNIAGGTYRKAKCDKCTALWASIENEDIFTLCVKQKEEIHCLPNARDCTSIWLTVTLFDYETV